MPSLIEISPCDGLLPVSEGGVTLSELAQERITSVAPFAGKEVAVGKALKALGLGWSGPGKAVAGEGRLCLWTGRDQAFLIGAEPEGLAGIAALTDQSDAWARMRLEGEGAAAVLTRLVPLDLGAAAFPVGHAARSGLGHMAMILHRSGAQSFEIMVFRSMAASAVHELHQAMTALAARAAL